MSELEALRRVAEAARMAVDANGKWPELGLVVEALEELDALPTEAPGEMVEVRADVFRERDGKIVVREHGYMILPNPMHIATITARVPLPAIPVIVATVEPAP